MSVCIQKQCFRLYLLILAVDYANISTMEVENSIQAYARISTLLIVQHFLDALDLFAKNFIFVHDYAIVLSPCFQIITYLLKHALDLLKISILSMFTL